VRTDQLSGLNVCTETTQNHLGGYESVKCVDIKKKLGGSCFVLHLDAEQSELTVK